MSFIDAFILFWTKGRSGLSRAFRVSCQLVRGCNKWFENNLNRLERANDYLISINPALNRQRSLTCAKRFETLEERSQTFLKSSFNNDKENRSKLSPWIKITRATCWWTNRSSKGQNLEGKVSFCRRWQVRSNEEKALIRFANWKEFRLFSRGEGTGGDGGKRH